MTMGLLQRYFTVLGAIRIKSALNESTVLRLENGDSSGLVYGG